MTPEEQRIAVAEQCGLNPFKWGFDMVHENGSDWDEYDSLEEAEEERDPKIDGPIERVVRCPDYLNELNDIAEAEKLLTHNQRHRWIYWLVEGREGNTTDEWCYSPNEVWKVATATCPERAEAFLRAIGKWQHHPAAGGGEG